MKLHKLISLIFILILIKYSKWSLHRRITLRIQQIIEFELKNGVDFRDGAVRKNSGTLARHRQGRVLN